MAKHIGSVCKLCRNERKKLFLKGERCNTVKCSIGKRPYPSGQHGQTRKKHSEHAIHLREKQKLKRTYGMLERQFLRYFEEATKSKGVTGTVLLQNLELRFDNVVFRSGMAVSRMQARQLIGHKHFLIDGKRVNIPSYKLMPGQIVSVQPKSKTLIKTNLESGVQFMSPNWMIVNDKELTLKIERVPEREDIDPEIKEQLIIEYYSR